MKKPRGTALHHLWSHTRVQQKLPSAGWNGTFHRALKWYRPSAWRFPKSPLMPIWKTKLHGLLFYSTHRSPKLNDFSNSNMLCFLLKWVQHHGYPLKLSPTSCHIPHSRSSGTSLFRRSARLYTARSGAVNRGRVTQEARLTGGFGEVGDGPLPEWHRRYTFGVNLWIRNGLSNMKRIFCVTSFVDGSHSTLTLRISSSSVHFLLDTSSQGQNE